MPASHIPKRIVCLQPSATVILDSIGQLGRVVACTKYCVDVVPTVKERAHTIVSDSWTAQSQQIVEAKPDLVIAAVPYQEEALSQILRAGIRFLGLAPRKLADIYVDIATIAGTVGALEHGQVVIDEMQRTIEAVRSKTQGASRPKVFCEEWGKPLISSQPWVAELVAAAGGEFLGQPGTQLSEQWVRNESPDVLVAAWCGAGNRVPVEKIVRTRGWEEMKAVQNRNVFSIPDEYLNTPAPTLLNGLMALAGVVHPELFPMQRQVRQITDVIRPAHQRARLG